jgi:hypothetical protein
MYIHALYNPAVPGTLPILHPGRILEIIKKRMLSRAEGELMKKHLARAITLISAF